MIAFAVPMNAPAGQPAGFALNCASVHAFCNVVNRAGNAVGIVRSTLWMFASPGFCATFTVRLAPLALLAFPTVLAVRVGLNGRFWQPPTWKRLLSGVALPGLSGELPVDAHRFAAGRVEREPSTVQVQFELLTSNGIPSRIVGNGSLTARICAV